MANKTFHIVMYPWFAFGHLTSFLHLSNKLAGKGHKISFLMPRKAKSKMEPFNLHPDLITLIPIIVPHVDGLPPDSETSADVPFPLLHLLMTAMDLTKPTIESHLRNLKPHFVFYDFTHWVPALSKKFNIKSVHYCTVSSATVGYFLRPERKLTTEYNPTEADFLKSPPDFPPSSIKLRPHEARRFVVGSTKKFGIGISFSKRQVVSFIECDAICFKSCMEMEGPYINYIEKQVCKPVLLAGPVVPELPSLDFDKEIKQIFDKFGDGKVIYCALGSECVLSKDQFQELLLGLELTGFPFFAALKSPAGIEKIEQALPDGFEERVKGRGFVYGKWVEQQLILKHPSVGCFVTHCGSGSLSEALISKCQIVLLPNIGDQTINARLMSGDLKVGVEIEKGEEDGLFSKEGVLKAVKTVMDDGNEISKEIRTNHTKWKEFLLTKGLEDSYIDVLVQKLDALLT